MPKNICTIILAAGASSRFGANKLLHRVDDMPMYEHIVKLAMQLETACTIIVTKYPQISQNLPENFLVVDNQRTDLGQSYSMRLGLKLALAQAKQFDGFLFCVSDQPYLSLFTMHKLCQVWQQKGGICALSHHGRRGNPVLFDSCYVPELLAVQGDTGGRSVIRAHLDRLTLVEVESDFELVDVDTKAALLQVLHKHTSKDNNS